MKNAGIILVFVLFVAAIVYVVVLQHDRQIGTINSWAQQNNYEIVSIDRPMWVRGPFWYKADKNTTVYAIVVNDEHGRQRTFYYYFFNSLMYDDQVAEGTE